MWRLSERLCKEKQFKRRPQAGPSRTHSKEEHGDIYCHSTQERQGHNNVSHENGILSAKEEPTKL